MVGASGLTGLKGQVQVSMASMVSGLLPLALTRIQAEADLDEKKINVRSFSATIAEGLIEGNVQVDDFMAVPAISAVFSISGVVPQKFMEAYKVPVKVSGILSGDGNIKCSGKAPEEIMGSLSGNFKAELKGGVLENMNLLSLGLGKVPLLPGLLDSVMMDLPLETKEDIAKGITRFDTCRASARIAGLALEDILAKITTRDLAVEAGGVLRLVEGFNMTADIRIAPDLSARLAGKASDLRALEDKEGRIYMPLNISGGLTTPKVMPDVGYLTEKILAARGGAQVQQILEGSPGTREAVNAIFDIFKKK
jgi:hypothetical protein